MNRYFYRKRQLQLSAPAASSIPELRHTKRVLLSLFGRFGAICQPLTIAIFSSPPERVVDFAQQPLVLRDPLMAGQSCQNRQCQVPLRMNRMIETSTFEPGNIWQCAQTVTTSEDDCIWQNANA